jgi:hypothetical protein
MMKTLRMKKSVKALLLLSIVFGLFTLSSCSKEELKDDADTRTSISATVNGTAKIFGLNTLASAGNSTTVTQGYASDGTKVSITIPGTLVEGKAYSTGNDKATVIYTLGEDATTTESYSNTNSAVIDLKITSLTTTNAKGTFSGNLLQDNVPGNAKTVTITNGTFNIKLK